MYIEELIDAAQNRRKLFVQEDILSIRYEMRLWAPRSSVFRFSYYLRALSLLMYAANRNSQLQDGLAPPFSILLRL
jgi:hypothetical protein